LKYLKKFWLSKGLMIEGGMLLAIRVKGRKTVLNYMPLN
jgi:hypothetical protein